MEFDGQIPFFLEQYLSKPASALPKNVLWIVDFEGITDVKTAILTTADREPEKWGVTSGLETLISTYVEGPAGNKGCFFVQAVSMPSESTVVNPEGIQQQHLLRTGVGGGRDAYNGLQMTFLDTNISFVDSVIRPWVVTTARLGMKARSGDQKYRATVVLYKLGIHKPKDPPVVLYKYTFYGACPISVSSEELNYIAATSPVNREVVFNYHYYSIENLQSVFTTNTESAVKNALDATGTRNKDIIPLTPGTTESIAYVDIKQEPIKIITNEVVEVIP